MPVMRAAWIIVLVVLLIVLALPLGMAMAMGTCQTHAPSCTAGAGTCIALAGALALFAVLSGPLVRIRSRAAPELLFATRLTRPPRD